MKDARPTGRGGRLARPGVATPVPGVRSGGRWHAGARSTADTAVATRAKRAEGAAWLKVLFILAGLASAAALAWMLFLPSWCVRAIERTTGFHASVARMAMNPFGGTARIDGLVLRNPAAWDVRDFVLLREFSAAVEARGTASGEITLSHLTLALDRLVIVTGLDGTTNLDAFTQALDEAAGGADRRRDTSKPPPWRIRQLTLQCDEVELVDLRTVPVTRRMLDLRLDTTLEEVTQPSQIIGG